MKMKWTKKEEEVLKRLYPKADIPFAEILKVFPGRSMSSIQNHATGKLGLHRGKSGEINQEQLIKLEKAFKI